MIYFLQDDSNLNIKIGHTASDPEERRKQLQTGNSAGLVLLATMEGGAACRWQACFVR